MRTVTWTLVFLPSRGRYFRPIANVPAGLDWHAARDLGSRIPIPEKLGRNIGAIFYVPSRESQEAGLPEDRDNVLMGRGVRIPIRWDAPALLDAATAEPAHDSTTYTTGECEAVRWGAIAEAAALADTESLEYQAYLSAVRNANDSLREPDLVAMGGWCGIALTTYFSALNDLRSEAAPADCECAAESLGNSWHTPGCPRLDDPCDAVIRHLGGAEGVLSFAPVTLHGRRLGTIEGRRVSSSMTLERCTQIELDFVPGRYGQPAQARIRHSAWNGALRRWEGHVALLIQDADLLDQLPIHPVG